MQSLAIIRIMAIDLKQLNKNKFKPHISQITYTTFVETLYKAVSTGVWVDAKVLQMTTTKS